MSTPAGSVPTQLIATSGPLPTPESYRVPGSLEIQLSSVSAEYDGTGAGGSFDPTLAIYSKDGKLISRTKVGSTVTAGDSAVCTWIPFLRQAQAAPTPGSTINAIELYDTTGTISIASGADTPITFNHHGSFDSTVYAIHTTGGKVDAVTLKKAGVYAAFGWVSWFNNFAGNNWLYNLATFGPTVTPEMVGLVFDAGAFGGTYPTLSYMRKFPASLAGDTGTTQQQFWAGQDSGIAQPISLAYWQFLYFGATDF